MGDVVAFKQRLLDFQGFLEEGAGTFGGFRVSDGMGWIRYSGKEKPAMRVSQRPREAKDAS